MPKGFIFKVNTQGEHKNTSVHAKNGVIDFFMQENICKFRACVLLIFQFNMSHEYRNFHEHTVSRVDTTNLNGNRSDSKILESKSVDTQISKNLSKEKSIDEQKAIPDTHESAVIQKSDETIKNEN